MQKLNFKKPKFYKLVQIESLQDLDLETRRFLEYHATKDLEEISLEDTNDFLRAAYYEYMEDRQDEYR